MTEDQDFDAVDLDDDLQDELDEVPEDDNAELADLLGVIEQDLIREIGGPWGRVRYDEVHQATGGVSYLGRAGGSVVLSFDSASRQITVGKAVGKWPGPGTIVWLVQEPLQTMTLERDGLEGLAEAVDAAAAAKASELVICRFCSCVVGPEFAFGDECCAGCASRYLGIRF